MNSTSKLSQDKTEINKIESKNIFKNLKSNYILKKIFNNVLKKKSFDIIRYNNNFKNRINISIKDYKDYNEYLEIYSPIEIEIKPVKDKYGLFINYGENNKLYYHIYFNNNEKEMKRLFFKGNDETIKIIIDYQIKSFEGLFKNGEFIEYINFKKFVCFMGVLH